MTTAFILLKSIKGIFNWYCFDKYFDDTSNYRKLVKINSAMNCDVSFHLVNTVLNSFNVYVHIFIASLQFLMFL